MPDFCVHPECVPSRTPSLTCPCGNPIPLERQRYRALYCSKRCQWRYKERNAEGTVERFTNAVCKSCDVPIPQEIKVGPPRQLCDSCSPRRRRLPCTWRSCKVCGTRFLPPKGNIVYCSKRCRSRSRGMRRPTQIVNGVNVRSESKRRRWKAAVLATYGPTCWLCRRPIDVALRWPHPESYSPDHVVKVADGGAPFDVANGRPSHLRCNLSRGAREGNRDRGRRKRAA